MATRKLLRHLLPKTLWGDRIFNLWLFYKGHGRFPEYPPVRFNDHLFALKSNGSHYDPLIQFVTDKEFAKLYFSVTAGRDYVIETYRILRTRSEIEDFVPDRLPCVIKPTHASGPILICTDPSVPLDRTKLYDWFGINRYILKREQNYRFLRPKIIVEEYFSEDGRTAPKDYKIFCFHGIPKFIQVDSGRFTEFTRSFYDLSWNRISMTIKYPAAKQEDAEPVLLEEMLGIARKLSAPFPFVRVDMYASETEIRIGELTFTPGGIVQALRPDETEFVVGSYLSDDAGSRA